MDLAPKSGTPEYDAWKEKRGRVEAALEENGLRYYRFGRVLPQGEVPQTVPASSRPDFKDMPSKPDTVDKVLEIIIRGLRRTLYAECLCTLKG